MPVTYSVHCAADEVFADDHDGNACAGDVLLSAGKEQTELAHVDRLGENVGGNVSHQRHISGVGKVVPLGAVDGIVQADVYIIRVRSEIGLLHLHLKIHILYDDNAEERIPPRS